MTKTAVILAAGMGVRLPGLVNDVVKRFATKNGQTLIEASIEKLTIYSIENKIIVTGHLNHFNDELSEKLAGVKTIKNEVYSSSGSMYSLFVARNLLAGCNDGFLLPESHLVNQKRALPAILNHPDPNAILMSGFTKSGHEVCIGSRNNLLVNMPKTLSALGYVDGEPVGIGKICAEMYFLMIKIAEKLFEQPLKVEYEHCIAWVAIIDGASTPKIYDLVWADLMTPNQI